MYDHVKNVAGLLSNGAFTPKHLISPGNPARTLATCVRVVIQALRWGFDPFAVADETYEVHGRMGYQGKIVIAVVNARAKLKGNLSFAYKGSGDSLTVTVSGTFLAESEPRTITLSVSQAKTDNKMWKTDPEQKLAYSGAIKWARRHCPELMAGVRTVEDLELMESRATLNHQPPEETTALLTADEAAAETVGEQTPAGRDLDAVLKEMGKAKNQKSLNDLLAEGKLLAGGDDGAQFDLKEAYDFNLARLS